MRLVNWVIITASAAAVSLATSAAEQGGEPPACGGDMPPPLAVPTGNELAFALEADGVQVYTCARGAGSYAWAFKAPEAALTEAGGRAAGTHYAGPTWESIDGSKVRGAKLEAATPDATAIPWLLLRAESHAGSGRMEDVTFVQRVRTWGGNVPAEGCDASHVGDLARVPYRALYCFYRKGSGGASR
ncbi:MAG TPA: DUF3455 domain-containing protein [Anaeromyxobacteraceae bacterium]|nr:DUF3455 domain-containing protein [Anaeromyxobacteraceae bacterium]